MTMAGLAQDVKTRPIIFGAESVRAILSGAKSQTRRVVKPHPWVARDVSDLDVPHMLANCPHGRVGERLWVREGWRPIVSGRLVQSGPDADGYLRYGAAYRADGATVWNERETRVTVMNGEPSGFFHINRFDKWVTPIHMPRDRSRITLELTEVRVERLQKISGFDARAEGYPEPMADYELMHYGGGKKCREWYRVAWDSLNAKRGFGWDSNPWVYVLAFKRIQPAAPPERS